MQPKKGNLSSKSKNFGTKKGFSYYKSMLDIAEFLRSKGNDIGKNYFVEHRESTKANPKFKKFNSDGVHIDTIGIYRQEQKKGQPAFYFVKSWDAGLDKSALSIYDFLIHELELGGQSNSLKVVHDILKGYDESDELYMSSNNDIATTDYSKSNDIEKFKKYNTVEKFTDFLYLSERGISETLLKNININNSLRIITHFNKKIVQKITNTAFVMKGSKGYTAYSCRNKMKYPIAIYDENGKSIPEEKREFKVNNFKGFPYAVRDSVYFCFLPKNTLAENKEIPLGQIKDLDQLSIYESGIDALSYYQMNTNQCQKINLLIASYEGAKGVKQDDTI
ncbi:MAG: hypothetical protein AB8F74_19435, partial [Saprospiraceae bacterium]